MKEVLDLDTKRGRRIIVSDVLVLLLKLMVVSAIQRHGTTATVQFVNGPSAILTLNDRKFEFYLKLAQRSLESRHPIGVAMDDNHRIVEVSGADNDIALEVRDRDKETQEVSFEGHDGIFTLRRDNPEFPRIGEILNASIRDKKRIWFVAKKPLLVINDAQFYVNEQTK
jgi:hypothetical protein